MEISTKQWYAVKTMSRAEKKIKERLDDLGVENYLPLCTQIKKWSDRKKKVQSPLVPGYLFVYIFEEEYFTVLKVPGVVSFLKEDRKMVPIPAVQIDNLRYVVEKSTREIEFSFENIRVGDKVRIILGDLEGFEGELVDFRGKTRVAICVHHFGCSLTSVEMDEVMRC